MFVLHPDTYLLPSYNISPFQTKDIHDNNQLPDSNAIDDYFNQRFNGLQYIYVDNGRKAINIALQQYNLQPTDVITIFTTSGNFYISSCVTREIEKFCSWSRKMEDKTKLIFVNHEFGYPYKNITELTQYNLPIIEDCCHSFFSTDADNSIGKTGDFAIYSFPKMFPLQIGGLLTAKTPITRTAVEIADDSTLRYVKNVLSHYIHQEETIIKRRINNYNYLAQQLDTKNLDERFPLIHGVVPGVFMFSVKNENINLPSLKDYLYAHGLQCSVFYGEQSFFIPVHQNLIKTDLDYFMEIISLY